ncbi:MAG: sugar transporter subunit [Hydrocarboniphaga sp.]|uniref:PTS sugar transporter subunit IIA n=1 Tax=Hydrocarboniphaga sp. TaxID=2033016 RepID=UPI00260AF609|nr:PTS sugar transporter subunit IIA [Hydrocarboniphaga sp.]MDB5969589.1 sugar transporter subunit [Hydrocarboniphaga sp.]
MKLSEILGADRVLSGTSVTSKKKALEELSALLAKGASSLVAGDVFNSLTGREKLGSTGLGHGVAIPHGRMAGVESSVGAFMRLKHPVDYDSHDGNPVDLVFGLLVPQAATEAHLKHLAAIAEMFSDEVFCAKLRAAGDEHALYSLLSGYTAA